MFTKSLPEKRSRLEEPGFPKTDIGLDVPFAIPLPIFLFRSDP
jgi:hypothetical protein